MLPNYDLKQLPELPRVILTWSQSCRSNQNRWDVSLKDKEKGRAGALEEQVSARAFPNLPTQGRGAEEAANEERSVGIMQLCIRHMLSVKAQEQIPV